MKSIGSYVAARNVPAGPERGAIQTLRATDRLTGMPVLLHMLPHTPRLPDLPEHPQLLPIVDHGDEGTGGYVVTELPMQATPASDALLAARDGLEALAALHMHGLTHGGISAAQLWEVDGRVVLTGAGLPWQDVPTTGGDLRDLARAVDSIGGLPAALSTLREAPDSMDARAALSLLDTPVPATVPARPRTQAHTVPSPATSEPPAVPGAAETPIREAPTPAVPDTRPRHDGSPIVLGGEAPDVQAPPPPESPAPVSTAGAETSAATATPPNVGPADRATATPKSRRSGRGSQRKLPAQATPVPETPGSEEPVPGTPAPETSAPPPEPGATPAHVRGAREAAQSAPLDPAPAPRPAPTPEPAPNGASAGAPVPAFSNAPAGTVETPQERRRRQNEERRAQAMVDMQAAAARKAERLRAEAQAALPSPIQIGFVEDTALGKTDRPAVLGEDDLPAWPEVQADEDSAPPPRLQMRNVERLPASLRREPEPEPAPEPEPSSGRLPARQMSGAPIRIGWDEDDSWRVVKTVQEPPAPQRRAPRWLLPLLGAALLVLLAVGVVNRVGRPAATATVCCDVAFTLRGAAGATARVSVLSAPVDANLTPGQELGRVPGRLHLPMQGTYRLRVVADGYSPGELSVTVPRTQPVTINLGP